MCSLQLHLYEQGLKWPRPDRLCLLTLLTVAQVVGPEQIADVVHRWTNIPVQKLTQTEKERLLRLKEKLSQRVVGQLPAVIAVSESILRSAAGLARRNKPIGSFLFLGPVRYVKLS